MEREAREIMKPKASIHDTECQFIKELRKRVYLQFINKPELNMKENILVDLSKKLAVEIVNVCTRIRESGKSTILLNQVLRSGTSIGANIHEAKYASSRSDFINKLQIALKECYETEYWIELFKDTHIVTEEECKDLLARCNKVRKLLIASITTAKENA